MFKERHPNMRIYILFFLCLFCLNACSLHSKPTGKSGSSSAQRGSKPYTIRGKTYYPLQSAENFKEEGVASWYGKDFHGKATASGERYDMYAMTAAHKTLPLGTMVKVTNKANGQSIVVKINDRGPFIDRRVIDLSHTGAKKLGILQNGTGKVLVQALEEKRYLAEQKRTNTTQKASQEKNSHTKNVVALNSIKQPAAKQDKLSYEQWVEATRAEAQKKYPVNQQIIKQIQDKRHELVSTDEEQFVNTSTPVSIAESEKMQQALHRIKSEREQYVVQVGAFSQKKNADGVKNSLSKEGAPTQTVFDEARKVWKVQVGPYSDLETASASSVKLRSTYPNNYVSAQ